MYHSTSRRTFLSHLLSGLAVLSLPPAFSRLAYAQAQGATPLRGNVSLLDAGGSNVVVCTTSEGLVLVDSGAPAYAKQLMDTLAEISNKGVHTLINTHWHPEQCGANEAIGKAGAAILAHGKTFQHLATEYYLPHEQRYHQPLPPAARPSVRFHAKGAVQVGGETVEYGPLVQAHTDGDSYVYFPGANVLAAGGAVAPDSDPELDWYGGGWIGGRLDSQNLLVALANDDTLIVPAQGRVMSKADLVAERDMTAVLYQRLNDLIRSGCSAECMQEQGALDGLGRTFNDPQRFLYAAYKGLWAHHYNLAPDIL